MNASSKGGVPALKTTARSTVQRCRYRDICTEIKHVLVHCGSRHDVVFNECTKEPDCGVVVEVAKLLYGHVTVDFAEHIETTLQKILGHDLLVRQSTASLISVFQKGPFLCPELGIEVRRSCEVKSCAFWTPREWTRNCIVFYMVDQDRDFLDFKEISILLNLDGQSIRKRWNNAIAVSTKHAMELRAQQTKQESTALVQPDKTIDPTLCVVCSAVLTKAAFQRSGFRYCGRGCYEKKSPVEIRLETEFSLSVKRILDVCRSSFHTRRAMRHALGVSNLQLDLLCDSHQIDISNLP